MSGRARAGGRGVRTPGRAAGAVRPAHTRTHLRAGRKRGGAETEPRGSATDPKPATKLSAKPPGSGTPSVEDVAEAAAIHGPRPGARLAIEMHGGLQNQPRPAAVSTPPDEPIRTQHERAPRTLHHRRHAENPHGGDHAPRPAGISNFTDVGDNRHPGHGHPAARPCRETERGEKPAKLAPKQNRALVRAAGPPTSRTDQAHRPHASPPASSPCSPTATGAAQPEPLGTHIRSAWATHQSAPPAGAASAAISRRIPASSGSGEQPAQRSSTAAPSAVPRLAAALRFPGAAPAPQPPHRRGSSTRLRRAPAWQRRSSPACCSSLSTAGAPRRSCQRPPRPPAAPAWQPAAPAPAAVPAWQQPPAAAPQAAPPAPAGSSRLRPSSTRPRPPPPISPGSSPCPTKRPRRLRTRAGSSSNNPSPNPPASAPARPRHAPRPPRRGGRALSRAG